MEQIWQIAANQGFGVLLLVIAVYYFYKRELVWETKLSDTQKKWEDRMEVLHRERIEERVSLIALIEQVNHVVESNTNVLQRLDFYLEKNVKNTDRREKTAA